MAMFQCILKGKRGKFFCKQIIAFPDFHFIHLRFISHKFINTDIKICRKLRQQRNVRVCHTGIT